MSRVSIMSKRIVRMRMGKIMMRMMRKKEAIL
jgi:hypothetical protein